MTIIACSRGPFNSARQAAEGVRAGVKPVRGGPTGDLRCRAIVETRAEEATCRGQVDLVILKMVGPAILPGDKPGSRR